MILKQRPCAVAVFGIYATYAFASWVNRPMEEQNGEADYPFVSVATEE